MSIYINAVYLEHTYRRCIRVLDVDVREDRLTYITLDKKDSVPRHDSYEFISSCIDDGTVEKIDAPNNSWHWKENVSPKRLARANRDWAIIRDFVLDKPRCFDKKEICTFTRDKASELCVHRITILRILYRFWSRGMNKDALIQYSNKIEKDYPLKISFDYTPLIREIEEMLEDGILDPYDSIQILRAKDPLQGLAYRPIVKWYYDRKTMRDLNAHNYEDDNPNIKYFTEMVQNYISDYEHLETMWVFNFIGEMEEWSRIT